MPRAGHDPSVTSRRGSGKDRWWRVASLYQSPLHQRLSHGGRRSTTMRSTSRPPPTGETVARAKRTERAEARRRYRAAAAADPENETAEDGSPAAGGARPASGSSAKSAAAAPTVRTSFSQAFRQSFRPLNVREDLAALPWIALHTKALWLPLLITFGSTVYIVATGGNDTISEFM